MFLALSLVLKKSDLFALSDFSALLPCFRHCMRAETFNYRTGRVLQKRGISSHIWARTWPLAHRTHTYTFSMLEAGGCDLSEGFLLWPVCQTVWRVAEGWRRLAYWIKKPLTCAFCCRATSLSSSLHFPSPLLLLRRITGRNWMFDPALLWTPAIFIWHCSLYLFSSGLLSLWLFLKRKKKS